MLPQPWHKHYSPTPAWPDLSKWGGGGQVLGSIFLLLSLPAASCTCSWPPCVPSPGSCLGLLCLHGGPRASWATWAGLACCALRWLPVSAAGCQGSRQRQHSCALACRRTPSETRARPPSLPRWRSTPAWHSSSECPALQSQPASLAWLISTPQPPHHTAALFLCSLQVASVGAAGAQALAKALMVNKSLQILE